jgi:outer membrane protein assembly factor BamB
MSGRHKIWDAITRSLRKGRHGGLPLLLLLTLSLLTPHLSYSEEPGTVVRVNERVADGVTLLWKAYVGRWNYVFTSHLLLFGDRVYHASNGDENDSMDPCDRLYCLSTDGRLLWSFTPPEAENADLNGVIACPDFVVVGCQNCYVYVLSHTGDLLWKFKTEKYVLSFSIGDVDKDGEMEVVVGSEDDNVYCLSGDSGKLEWSFMTGGDVDSSPAIGDVDKDGEMEVVVGSEDDNVYCLSGDSGKLEWSFMTDDKVHSSPAIGDVDKDGEMEVVVGSWDDNIYCLSGDSGKLEWSFMTDDRIESSPAIGDVDRDGEMEVVVGSRDDNVYCLSGDSGKLEWNFKTDNDVPSSPAIGDVDGDGEMEVVIGSMDNKVYCLSGGSGKLEWSFMTKGEIDGSLAIGDVDGDGRVEIAVASWDGWLYLLRVEKPCGEILWARWHGDGFGTGLLENALSYGEASKLGETDIWTPPPQIFIASATHPSPDKWYASPNVELSWKPQIQGIIGYYIAINPEPITLTPDTAQDYVIGNSKTFKDLQDGSWVFQIKGEFQNGSLTPPYSLRVNVDATPELSSSTHPDPNGWYQLRTAKLSWSIKDIASAKSAYYVLDRNPDRKPTKSDSKAEGMGITVEIPSDGEWYLHLVWEDELGNLSKPAHYRLGVDTTPPEPVVELSASLTEGGKVRLRWSEPKDNASGVGSYQVYRSKFKGALGSRMGTNITGTEFTDETAEWGEIYYYTVMPVDKAGNKQVQGNKQISTEGLKMSSSVSLSVSKEKVEAGEELTLSGSVELPYASEGEKKGLSVRIILKSPGGTEREEVVRTGSGGKFEHSLKPMVLGRWKAKASWEGNDEYEGSESEWVEFEVVKPAPPGIAEVKEDSGGKWLKVGDVLKITVRQADDGKVAVKGSFSIGDEISGKLVRSGDRSWTGSYTVKEGDYVEGVAVKAVLEDEFGGKGEGESRTKVRIDGIPPEKPRELAVPDAITRANAKAVEVSGRAEPNSTVWAQITDAKGKTVKGSAKASSDERFTVKLDASALSDGKAAFQIWCFDQAGNESEKATAGTEILLMAEFTLKTDEVEKRVKIGGNVTWDVEVEGTGGFRFPVKLEVMGKPSGVDVNVVPDEVNPGGKAQVKVSLPSGFSEGRYSFTLKGSGEGVEKELELQFVAWEKEATSISLYAVPSKAEFKYDDVELSGEISPKMKVELRLEVMSPNGVRKEQRLSTDSDGKFSWSFKPDEMGKWKTRAKWEGNDEYEPSESGWVEFEVVRPAPPGIASVEEDSGGRWLKVGDVLKITVRQADDGKVAVKGSFSIGDKISGELRRTGDRTWSGSYTVKEGDYVDGLPVIAELEDEFGGRSRRESDTKVKLDGVIPERPSELVVPNAITRVNAKAVEITGKAEPNSTVWAQITDAKGKAAKGSAKAGDDGGFTVKLDGSGLSDGKAVVGVWCVDRAGNESERTTTETEILLTAQFSLTVDETEKRVNRGETASYLISILPKNGFRWQVSLSTENLPRGLSASLDPSKLKPNERGTLIVTVPDDFDRGSYEFQLVAEGEGVSRKLTLSLRVGRKLSFLILSLSEAEMRFYDRGHREYPTLEFSGKLSGEDKPLRSKEILITLIPPSGDAQELKTVTDRDGRYKVKRRVDRLAGEGVRVIGTWRASARWSGDEEYEGAESSEEFTIRRGESWLDWVYFPGRGEVGKEAEIKFRLQPSLSGREVTVVVKDPAGEGRPVRVTTDDYGVGGIRIKPEVNGRWKITVDWEGDDLFEGIYLENDYVVETLAKAVIALCGVDPGAGERWRRFGYMVGDVYKRLFRMRGLSDEDIYLLSPGRIGEEVVVDEPTTKEGLRSAITEWAVREVEGRLPLFVYLIGEGSGVGELALQPRPTESDPATYLRADELDGWLSEFERSSGVRDVTVIIDSCFSGGFVRELSRPGRIVISSTRDTDTALVGVCSFTGFLSQEIYLHGGGEEHAGLSLGEALRKVVETTKEWGQTPWFDANGDGRLNDESDYFVLEEKFIPADVTTASVEVPEIVDVSESVKLNVGEREASFWVRVVGTNIKGVWLEVLPPDFKERGETWDLEVIQLEYDRADGVYRGRYDRFTEPGLYKVIFYAESVRGDISVPVWRWVEVKGASWDVNGDGVVDILDLVLVGKNYGSSGPEGDVNGDGKVDILDLVLVGKHYGEKVGMGAPRMREEKRLGIGGGAVSGEVVSGWAVGERVTLERQMWAVVSRYDRGQPSAVHSTFQRIEGGVPTGDIAIRIGDVGVAFVGLGRPFDRLPLHALSDDAIGVTVDGRMVRIALREVPKVTELLPNYPNPFNPETWMPFRLARDGEVVIRIYDVRGRLVRDLDLGMLEAGVYEGKGRAAYWDGRNEMGEEVSSGIYVIEFSVGRYRAFRKMCLVR